MTTEEPRCPNCECFMTTTGLAACHSQHTIYQLQARVRELEMVAEQSQEQLAGAIQDFNAAKREYERLRARAELALQLEEAVLAYHKTHRETVRASPEVEAYNRAIAACRAAREAERKEEP